MIGRGALDLPRATYSIRFLMWATVCEAAGAMVCSVLLVHSLGCACGKQMQLPCGILVLQALMCDVVLVHLVGCYCV